MENMNPIPLWRIEMLPPPPQKPSNKYRPTCPVKPLKFDSLMGRRTTTTDNPFQPILLRENTEPNFQHGSPHTDVKSIQSVANSTTKEQRYVLCVVSNGLHSETKGAFIGASFRRNSKQEMSFRLSVKHTKNIGTTTVSHFSFIFWGNRFFSKTLTK